MLCGVTATDGCDLCSDCCADLPYLRTACRVCALPLTVVGICGRCLRREPKIHRSHAIFHYASPVDFFIQRLKFNRKLNYARLLGVLMARELAERYSSDADDLPKLIIPVPLHPARMRDRGYNQSLELARPVSALFNIPIDYSCCVRIHNTALQSDLPARLRRKNVKGVFRMQAVEPDHVVIIDDVMTTGYTVNELAGVIRNAGVDRVDVWTCARASSLKI